jgi:TPP-dependent pyruvate/acetoin dehydrogenase alpha subunit
MAGKVGQATAAAAVSTGGSLISDVKLKQLYATMVQCRLLAERACRLRGKPQSAGLYAASVGQEAIATGCAIDLKPDDTIALPPQNAIAALVRGVPLGELVAQVFARPTAHSQSPNIIMPSPTQCTLGLATSAALANKQKKKSNVVVVFSDKATTTLEYWHEALELAASKSLPIIFVVEDNPSTDPAIFKATEEEEEAPSEKLRSYGFPIIPVDANDVVAVYRVACESVERVRQGGSPVLVQGKPYRLFSKTKQRAAAWRSERDPLIHMEGYLKAKRLFTPSWKLQVVQEFSRNLDTTLREARKKSDKTAEKAQKPPQK